MTGRRRRSPQNANQHMCHSGAFFFQTTTTLAMQPPAAASERPRRSQRLNTDMDGVPEQVEPTREELMRQLAALDRQERQRTQRQALNDQEYEDEEPTVPPGQYINYSSATVQGPTYTPQQPLARVNRQQALLALRDRTNATTEFTFGAPLPSSSQRVGEKRRGDPHESGRDKRLMTTASGSSTASSSPRYTDGGLLLSTSGGGQAGFSLQDDANWMDTSTTWSSSPTQENTSFSFSPTSFNASSSTSTPLSSGTVVNALMGTVPPNGESDAQGKITPAFARGYIPGRRPTARDYAPEPKAAVLDGCRYFEAKLMTKTPFPRAAAVAGTAGPQTLTGMCDGAWVYATTKAGVDYACTTHVSRLITARTSRIRGDLVSDHIRPKTQTQYKFGDGAYQCKDPATLARRFENPIVFNIIKSACFNKKFGSMGVVFEEMFSPISLELIALIYTGVQWCIEEWSTGRQIKKTFDGNTASRSYVGMLADVKKWEAMDPTFCETLRKKWTRKLRESAGVEDEEAPPSIVTEQVQERMRDDIAGRTGDTDSEPEAEDEEDGDDDDVQPR
ncbi:hypothetical protein HMN09_01403000 [Mycena chlorophos]|uniref:DUF6532 domain-containing protein n=1 Tax=Mycena chlorophos TaxID=658473 RepID=A0A8H6VSF2_MYCCL|nr:hypothetical protein HMN09_01403000 [Mycena chlorophos]